MKINLRSEPWRKVQFRVSGKILFLQVYSVKKFPWKTSMFVRTFFIEKVLMAAVQKVTPKCYWFIQKHPKQSFLETARKFSCRFPTRSLIETNFTKNTYFALLYVIILKIFVLFGLEISGFGDVKQKSTGFGYSLSILIWKSHFLFNFFFLLELIFFWEN